MEKNKRRSGEPKRSGESKRSGEAKRLGAAKKAAAAVAAAEAEENQNEIDEQMQMYDDEEGGTRVCGIYIPPPVKPYCSTESKGPRLMIKEIVNENFKSYAGKVVLGPFHHCFTAIIGPNGSGKSNVIDSMLFVFGYRAQKIRCKKLSVLLHNSAKCPNTQMCSVAVHFKQILDKEKGHHEEIENSDIIIARTAFKDNTSYYTINGRRVQFKEVSKLLKEHGVDLDHNRFLILQGEVESIAMMKPKALTENECGMLEYLEDIIGTTRYKVPLEQINNRVETLTEERTEKHNRCKLAEREMKDLEQPYNEAIEHLKIENDFIRRKNLLMQKILSEQNQKLQEFEKEKEGVVNELKEHDDNVNELLEEKKEKENSIMESSANYSKLCKTKDELEQKHTKTSNNYTETQNTMVATNKRRKQNQEQITKLETILDELTRVPKKNQDEINDCEKKVEKLSKEKTKIENELQINYAEIENQTRSFIDEREKLETELIDKKKYVEESKAELQLAESELKILQHDEMTEKRKYECLRSSFEESTQSLDEKNLEYEQLKKVIPQIKEDVTKKSIELQNIIKDEKELQNKLFSYKAELSEKKASMQIAKSNNKVLDSLMKQKIEGNIPGILGRLGDLGGIDAKYDVAISTACGRIDNIVVDTVNTAQDCIEYLKRYDVGRASFIALEKVQHLQRYCVTKITTPENVPRLFDLVQVEDERVLPAFYFALRNTLVANDLDQGTRIAYGQVRYRVVTLRGDLIETSGTMSGGGRTQLRGKMGQKVRTQTRNSISGDGNISAFGKKDLEQLEVRVEETQSQINFIQEEQGRLEREINNLKNQLMQKEKDERKINVSIRSLIEQLPRVEAQLKLQKQRMESTHSDKKKVMELQNEIKLKRETYEKYDKTANKITDQITEINKKITDIHGDKIKSVQKKIDQITKQITNLNGHISKLKVAITTSERNFQKTEKQIEDLKVDIKNAEENLILLKEKRTQYENDCNELQKEIENIKIEIENIEKSTITIRSEISIIQKKENDLKMIRVEIEEKLKAIEKKINDTKHQIPAWKNKLKALKLHDIPGQPIDPTNSTLKTYTEEELNSYKLKDLQFDVEKFEEDLKLKKPNLSAIQEYLNKREVYLQRVKILEDITNKRNEMRQLYDDVRKKRYTEFMQGFHIITKKLKEMYQMITQGGDAELELIDSMDPFTEGVSFSVRPPKKTWKNISNLSGGEKTLSSLALVFALHYYKPSPLYFMDEIDAALDFKNISIVAHYIKERTKNAQFIIISLRSNMFELSDYIVGIYKVLDCTHALTVDNIVPVISKNFGIADNDNSIRKDNDDENNSPLQQSIVNHTNNEMNTQQSQEDNNLMDITEQQQQQLNETNDNNPEERIENQKETESNEIMNTSQSQFIISTAASSASHLCSPNISMEVPTHLETSEIQN